MKLFTCGNCGNLVYFENTACARCGHALGYEPNAGTIVALAAREDGAFDGLGAVGGRWLQCQNAAAIGCNWLAAADSGQTLCRACGTNGTIPDLGVAGNLDAWREIESAKRRLFAALVRFGLDAAEGPGLTFDLLADVDPAAPVLTGHEEGRITINIAEADPAERERRRLEMGEPYRTLLGHMRHEVGHFYWDRLVRDAGLLDRSRAVFGDDGVDYAQALQAHYARGAAIDWRGGYVSAYAASHAWEDFAETWAHYLHIVDTLDTAASFGVEIAPPVSEDPGLRTRIAFDPYRAPGVAVLIAAWLPLTAAVNNLNRSMGLPDLYPFVLSPAVIGKLGFVHDLLATRRIASNLVMDLAVDKQREDQRAADHVAEKDR